MPGLKLSSVLVSTDSGYRTGLPTCPAVYPKSSPPWPSTKNVWSAWNLTVKGFLRGRFLRSKKMLLLSGSSLCILTCIPPQRKPTNSFPRCPPRLRAVGLLLGAPHPTQHLPAPLPLPSVACPDVLVMFPQLHFLAQPRQPHHHHHHQALLLDSCPQVHSLHHYKREVLKRVTVTFTQQPLPPPHSLRPHALSLSTASVSALDSWALPVLFSM